MRLLKGQDPDPDKLEEDCEKLEERLAEQEQKLLEKELILEEETRLTDRVSKKVRFDCEIELRFLVIWWNPGFLFLLFAIFWLLHVVKIANGNLEFLLRH